MVSYSPVVLVNMDAQGFSGLSTHFSCSLCGKTEDI